MKIVLREIETESYVSCLRIPSRGFEVWDIDYNTSHNLYKAITFNEEELRNIETDIETYLPQHINLEVVRILNLKDK